MIVGHYYLSANLGNHLDEEEGLVREKNKKWFIPMIIFIMMRKIKTKTNSALVYHLVLNVILLDHNELMDMIEFLFFQFHVIFYLYIKQNTYSFDTHFLSVSELIY